MIRALACLELLLQISSFGVYQMKLQSLAVLENLSLYFMDHTKTFRHAVILTAILSSCAQK